MPGAVCTGYSQEGLPRLGMLEQAVGYTLGSKRGGWVVAWVGAGGGGGGGGRTGGCTAP